VGDFIWTEYIIEYYWQMIKKLLLQWLSIIYFMHRFELCLQVQMFGTYSYKTSS
ncbi:unnamed protein product, partial [Musa acuminata subsp. burmannicoides]